MIIYVYIVTRLSPVLGAMFYGLLLLLLSNLKHITTQMSVCLDALCVASLSPAAQYL